MNLKNAYNHLKTINHHRHLVMQGCFRAGLYRQGWLHDLSKYTPVEFLVGAKYFQGERSPNNAEREATGVSRAWLHHKGRNKHHMEYWIDYNMGEGTSMTGMPMPKEYIVEMFIDRVSACKNYQKEMYTDANPLKYFERGRSHYMMHERTGKQLEFLLTMLKDHGEAYTYAYIRKKILHNDNNLLRRLRRWEKKQDFTAACKLPVL